MFFLKGGVFFFFQKGVVREVVFFKGGVFFFKKGRGVFLKRERLFFLIKKRSVFF